MTASSVIETTAGVIEATEGLSVLYDPPADGPREGRFAEVPTGLHQDVHALADRLAPRGLYTHQHLAVESVLGGRNVIAATRTSSGKSMIFALPALDALCREPDATSLFLYPQKALANDQLLKLVDAAKATPELARRLTASPHLVSRYDGGTEQECRKAIREQVQLLLTNPDMLHLGILQHHQTGWARFFANLKYVAIDECHEYRGIFGTNVGYVLRRLRQICRSHGSDPKFIATSATIAQPQQHLKELTGCDFELIGPEADGSTQGRRKFWMLGGTDHYYDTGRKLAVSLIEQGLSVLVFCPSRVTAERMLARMKRKDGELDERVAVYRSGLTSQEREEIERKLHAGEKKLVFSTSALELGIDIGSLDVVICMGLPNSMMSLWQRAGRVARGGREGAIILLPSESPLDTYFSQHPHELFSRQTECLALNLENARVSCQHYTCAVQEIGGSDQNLRIDILGPQAEKIRTLRNAGELDREEFYYSDPHVQISLRNTGETRYQIVHGHETIGEIGSFHLLREAPRNALYRHNGRSYRVRDVIRGRQLISVVPEWTNNETVSFIQKSIRQKVPLKIREFSGFTISLARIDVTEFLKAVTEKDAGGRTVRTHAATGMPNHRLPTEGVSITFREAFIRECRNQLDVSIEPVIQSIERLTAQLFPTVSGPCDSQDYSSATDCTKEGRIAIYLYDNVYDGVNLTEIAFDRFEPLLAKVQEHIRGCDCPGDEGCVRCVADPYHETTSSKSGCLLVTQAVLDQLRAENPPTADFSDQRSGLEQAPREVECSACSAKIRPDAKFCSECGARNTGADDAVA